MSWGMLRGYSSRSPQDAYPVLAVDIEAACVPAGYFISPSPAQLGSDRLGYDSVGFEVWVCLAVCRGKHLTRQKC